MVIAIESKALDENKDNRRNKSDERRLMMHGQNIDTKLHKRETINLKNIYEKLGLEVSERSFKREKKKWPQR